MDLRDEIDDQELIQAVIERNVHDKIDPATRILLDACVKLTKSPASMKREDVEQLRSVGFSDNAIHDAFQVAGYFNYINRLCDGLGVDLEDFMENKTDDKS